MGGRRIMSLKPLGLQSEAFSREKRGEGRERHFLSGLEFLIDISDWNFLPLSIHTTCITMSYMKRLFFLL